MTRYENLMDLNAVERRTKMLRLEDMDGYTLGYQEWWLDEDGYPSHPVDADEKTGPQGEGRLKKSCDKDQIT
jgi:hypothetical protein